MKRNGIARIAAFWVCLCLVFPVCASAAGFTANVPAINEAARSVLMLEIYADSEAIATGSGFLVYDDQTLITNHHVIEDAEEIVAYSDDGDEFRIDTILYANEALDLAILRFSAPTGLKPLPIHEGSILRAEPIVAIGSPQGLLNTISMGNVSAIFTEDGVDYIQFTAPISSGSSGGALLNDDGAVIGVTSSALVSENDEIVQNLNFAVNATEISKLLANMDSYAPVSLGAYRSNIPPVGGYPRPTVRPNQPSVPGQEAQSGIRSVSCYDWQYEDIEYADEGDEYVPRFRFSMRWTDSAVDNADYAAAVMRLGDANGEIQTCAINRVLRGFGDVCVAYVYVYGYFGEQYRIAIAESEDMAAAALRDASSPGATTVSVDLEDGEAAETLYKRGDSGEEVASMQQLLIAFGWLNDSADGSFGPKTEDAVKRFQEHIAVKATGAIDARTGCFLLFGDPAKMRASDGEFALIIDEEAYAEWDYISGNRMKIHFEVTNISNWKEAESFELSVFAAYTTDTQAGRMAKREYGEEEYTVITSGSIRPGETVYSDYVTLYEADAIGEVSAGISKIVYSDGTIAKPDEIEYYYWVID